MGNSITEGEITNGVINQMSWRFRFWEIMDSVGVKIRMVGYHKTFFNENPNSLVATPVSTTTGHVFERSNEAYYGITSTQFLNGGGTWDGETLVPFANRINDSVKGYTPDIAFLHIGTNDTFDSLTTVNNIKGIIDVLQAKNPNIIIFLAKLITPWVHIVNQSVDSIAKEYKTKMPSSKVIPVDLASGFINRPDSMYAAITMTYDWVHPNPKGQDYMSQKWYKAYMSLNDTIKPIFNDNTQLSNLKMVTNSSCSVNVSWDSATDNKWVAGYNVYVNGRKINWRESEGAGHQDQCIALVPGNSFFISDIPTNSTCNIVVSAVDYANNETFGHVNTITTPKPIWVITIVVNNSASSPIQNARVTYNDTTITTDSTGKAVFANVVQANGLVYTISKTGFQTATGKIDANHSYSKTITLLPATIISENEENTINIFPNPSNGSITIENAGNSIIQIYDILGIQVKTIVSQDAVLVVDLGSLKNGNYFIKVIQDNKIISKKITIIK